MGDQEPDYAKPMIQELHNRIFGDSVGIEDSEIAWEAGYWANAIQNEQEQLWVNLSDNPYMSYTRLRQFVISALGDAIAYQRVPSNKKRNRTNYYALFHRSIKTGLKNLRRRLGGDKPLIVIAHSLGSVIMSNYIWDAQHGKVSGAPFERMETLAGFITFGSTIPLFALAYTHRRNFLFPPGNIGDCFPGASQEEIDSVVQWINFFDADDVLGYPIHPLGVGYEIVDDREVNVGGLLTSWNPLSHKAYWTDNDFTVPVAEAIGGVLKLMQNTRKKSPPLKSRV